MKFCLFGCLENERKKIIMYEQKGKRRNKRGFVNEEELFICLMRDNIIYLLNDR